MAYELTGVFGTISATVPLGLRPSKHHESRRGRFSTLAHPCSITLSLVRADVQAGFDQFARGEARTYDKTSGRQLAERIKTRGRAARAKKR